MAQNDCSTDSLNSNTREDNSTDNTLSATQLSTAEGKLYSGSGMSFIGRKCYLDMPAYSS
jgi:hypothetical protein